MEMMSRKERQIYMYTQIFNWINIYVEGIDEGEISIQLIEDLDMGLIKTEQDAIAIQKLFDTESDRIIKRLIKIKRSVNPQWHPMDDYKVIAADVKKDTKN